jgi:cAMP-dependent protein kinase regulator
VYNDGDIVLRQGDIGDTFYIIELGEAVASQKDNVGVEHDVKSYKKGDYFGGFQGFNCRARSID